MTQEEHELLVNLSKDMNDMKAVQEILVTRIDGVEEKNNQEHAEIFGKLDILQESMIDIKGALVVLENNLYDRTAALFDAREVSLDKFKENNKKIKSIDDTLENHAFRISLLESKIS